jgi:hypothetical protein
MLTILSLIGSVTVLFALLLAIVVIGIRHEPQTEELSEQAPSLVAAFVRRLLGVYVRKPDSPAAWESPSRSEPLNPNAPDPDVLGRR